MIDSEVACRVEEDNHMKERPVAAMPSMRDQNWPCRRMPEIIFWRIRLRVWPLPHPLLIFRTGSRYTCVKVTAAESLM